MPAAFLPELLMETKAFPDVPAGTIGVYSPRGTFTILHYRDGTSDLSTIGSTFRLWGKLDDEYRTRELFLHPGDVFVDIGAHIGAVIIAVLVDNPEARGIAVEPLAENVDVIAASAESAGVADRLTILHAAIGPGKTAEIGYGFEGDDYLRAHRFIGGMTLGLDGAPLTSKVPTVSLKALIKKAGGQIAALKMDCEGCEWTLLEDPLIGKVPFIVGEGHPADWLERTHKALDATHDVAVIDDRGGPGTFLAVAR